MLAIFSADNCQIQQYDFKIMYIEIEYCRVRQLRSHNKLVNSEERKMTLEVDNSEWEVWRQALKKALASEGMRDMGDPTFEELFEQSEKFFTIAQQGPKGDY
ncbi:hypothetical protein GIB67_019588 [Kingdonia uniflora]|uniref:Uncharacterized protein n=1 Tax=Kingdonia uniflora TaxID=39325 RepID=A0A7J7N135_9MAGN|nr:hypothetical protein GIB67_019588 [Kingdonia uniflora]